MLVNIGFVYRSLGDMQEALRYYEEALPLSRQVGDVSGEATTLNNIGPGLGAVGPTDNYAHIPIAGKWLLSLLMLMGRLEVYTVIILLSPSYWKK